MTKQGIEQLKQAALLAVKFANAWAEAAEDGKLTLWEKIELGVKGGKLPVFIYNHFKDLKAEFKDLDESEKGEIVGYVAAELELPSAELSQIVEESFDLALTIAVKLQRIAQLFKEIK